MKTESCKRLKERFQCNTSEAYLSFMWFITQDFEAFLRRFQFEQPMIHLLYLSMVEMIRSIMTKFIKKKYLVLEDGSPKNSEDILSVDPLKSEVSSTDFILVPMMLQEYTQSRFILQKYQLDTPKWKGSNVSEFSTKPIFSEVLLRFQIFCSTFSIRAQMDQHRYISLVYFIWSGDKTYDCY